QHRLENINFLGFVHLAFSVGSEAGVIDLTERLRQDGYSIISEPRVTGDGYFESCIADPEGNLIEITL
ncbi:MAG: VOC family protein, partial [Gorillibacterium sp.]|nr:VOC family protein [Gorillibacterium sp.]